MQEIRKVLGEIPILASEQRLLDEAGGDGEAAADAEKEKGKAEEGVEEGFQDSIKRAMERMRESEDGLHVRFRSLLLCRRDLQVRDRRTRRMMTTSSSSC